MVSELVSIPLAYSEINESDSLGFVVMLLVLSDREVVWLYITVDVSRLVDGLELPQDLYTDLQHLGI